MQDANETTSSSNTTMKSNHISDTLPLGGEGSNETCGDTDSSRGSIHSHREHGTSFAPPSAADAAAMAAEAERSHEDQQQNSSTPTSSSSDGPSCARGRSRTIGGKNGGYVVASALLYFLLLRPPLRSLTIVQLCLHVSEFATHSWGCVAFGTHCWTFGAQQDHRARETAVRTCFAHIMSSFLLRRTDWQMPAPRDQTENRFQCASMWPS